MSFSCESLEHIFSSSQLSAFFNFNFSSFQFNFVVHRFIFISYCSLDQLIRVSDKSTYNASYSEHHQHETTIHRHDCLQKNPSFNLNDICLNANILGSCSPTETIAAGSNSGSIGVRTGHSLTNDQFNQNVRMNIYPSHHSNCIHSDCSVKKINETVPLLTSSHCNCGVSIDTSAPTPSGPINWIPNVGAFNIGISGGGCFEDRHSISVESDTDANNSMKLTNNCQESGRNWQNDMNCGKFKLNKQLSGKLLLFCRIPCMYASEYLCDAEYAYFYSSSRSLDGNVDVVIKIKS